MINIMIVDDHTLMRRIIREVIEKESDLEIVAEATNGREAGTLAAQTQPDVVLMDLDMPDCDGLEGTELVLRQSPHSHVVILTASRRQQHLFQALQRGAVGYVTKDIEPEKLTQAIRDAAHNQFCLPTTFTAQVVAHLRTSHREQHGDAYLIDESEMHQEAAAREQEARVSSSHIDQRFMIRRQRTLQQEQSTSFAAQNAAMRSTASEEPRPLTEREQEILDLMRRGRKNREIAIELCIAESTVHKHVQNIFEKLHARNRTEAIYLTSASK